MDRENRLALARELGLEEAVERTHEVIDEYGPDEETPLIVD